MNKLPLAVLFCLLLSTAASADVRTANIFGDNMVLQRNVEVPVWGWSDPGDEVIVKARDQVVRTQADANGRWMVKLNSMEVGDPFELSVKGSRNEIKFQNVVVGEVWICSGQSNMEWTVNGARDAEQERAAAQYPMIRQIKMNHVVSTTRLDDGSNSGWQVCSPETVGDFTAVGYFFGRHLHQELHVPIGLVNTSWGGTIVEAWISGKSLATHPDFKDRIAQIESEGPRLSELQDQFKRNMADWQVKYDAAVKSSEAMGSPDLDDGKWAEIDAPGGWESQGYPQLDGIAWYRKTVTIPKPWIGKELALSIGMVDDIDRTLVNGKQIGSMQNHTALRKYKIDGNMIDDDTVDIAVEVNDTGGAGGIFGTAEQMTVGLADGSATLPLAGKWKFQPNKAMAELPPRPQPPGFNGPNNPTALFNSMVNPLIPYAFQGAIWYQGESNADRAKQYQTLFPLLINDWRREWKRELPFYWVQLANFMANTDQPVDSAWAELREAQSKTLSLPKTGQAVIIDIGDARDIHPKNKQDVGKRLALIALNQTYGKRDVAYSGPVYKSMSIDGDKIRLTLDHDTGLKSSDGQPLKYFAIAGEDKKFVWADAVIDNQQVVVSSSQVASPIAVRYAWANNPEGCNLTNASGIPASPFRTDSWPGVTENNK